MATVKTKVQYDPTAPITTFQKKRIMHNCAYQMDIKEEYVQWVTGDVKSTSLGSLTQEQAVRIMERQEGKPSAQHKEPFAVFDSKNAKHRVILSLLHQAGWTNDNKGKDIPDMVRFANWLQSKAPVKKPLADQEPAELEKTIKAMEGVVRSRYR